MIQVVTLNNAEDETKLRHHFLDAGNWTVCTPSNLTYPVQVGLIFRKDIKVVEIHTIVHRTIPG